MELDRIIERTRDLAATRDRTDLRERLERTLRRLEDPASRIMVVGEFKQGKSKLINALVNAPACPVGDDIATSVTTVVRYGDVPSASVLVLRDGHLGSDGLPAVDRQTIQLDEIAEYASERGNPSNIKQLASAEVYLPRQLLADGLSIVDLPGVGGLTSAHSMTTLSALAGADAMIFVSDASQEYTEPELQFLATAMRLSPLVTCVLTKTDLHAHWREVGELDRAHLAGIRPGIPLFPVSSDLRMLAARQEDAALNEESGFPELVSYLRRTVIGQAERIRREAVSQDILFATEHLGLAIQAELRALVDPANSPLVLAEIESAKGRIDELRRRSSRWQTTLNDGISDLIADMEHDLRDRLRMVQREAEESIDVGDPGPGWDEFIDWIEQRVAAAISDTFVWTNERAQWLSGQVAGHFADDEVPLPVFRVDDTEDVLDPVDFIPQLDDGHTTVLEKALIGMRGSYGGVLMVGLVTGIMGMALINPFSIAAGLIIGAKAYHDDKVARLKKRQAEAKTLVRRQVDEVVFQVGKQLKDRLRLVQRSTRDHFTTIADEFARSLADSAQAARSGTGVHAEDRNERITELRGQLAEVRALRAEARELVESPESTAEAVAS